MSIGEKFSKNGWELIFSKPRNNGDLPVLKHAIQIKEK